MYYLLSAESPNADRILSLLCDHFKQTGWEKSLEYCSLLLQFPEFELTSIICRHAKVLLSLIETVLCCRVKRDPEWLKLQLNAFPKILPMIIRSSTTDVKKRHDEIIQTILQLIATAREGEEGNEDQHNHMYGLITSKVCMMNAIHQLNKRK